MTMMQFLMQFLFVSIAECRRSVSQRHVKINGIPVKYQDLENSVNGLVKVGDELQIGVRFKKTITPDYLPKVTT